MVVSLNQNIEQILIDAGYAFAGDYGFFRNLNNNETKKYNKRCYKEEYGKATKAWRFHIIAMSDFTFNIHLDFGQDIGHGYINDHWMIKSEVARIKQV